MQHCPHFGNRALGMIFDMDVSVLGVLKVSRQAGSDWDVSTTEAGFRGRTIPVPHSATHGSELASAPSMTAIACRSSGLPRRLLSGQKA